MLYSHEQGTKYNHEEGAFYFKTQMQHTPSVTLPLVDHAQ